MSLGFAAFSTTLNITSSASVSPDSGDFSVGFYASTTQTTSAEVITTTKTGSATSNNVSISAGSTKITGLNANFVEPGDSVTYSLYVGNTGKYDAYLHAINFLNVTG